MFRQLFMNKPDEDNWVKFRFWIPRKQLSTASELDAESQQNPDVSKNHTEGQLVGAYLGQNAQETVGHVSIETKNIYASLWPDDNNGIGLQSKHAPLFVLSPEVDIELEDREPDHEITLYTLKPEAIEDKYNELKKQTKHWSLLGRGEGENSCASQTLELSIAGGMTRMDLFYPVHSGFTYVTPPSMFNLVNRYKNMELNKFPETASYVAVRKEPYTPDGVNRPV